MRDHERRQIVPPAPGLRAALDAAETAAALRDALVAFGRTLGSTPERVTSHHASALNALDQRLSELGRAMAQTRFMALEMAHFCEHWHPIAPSCWGVLTGDAANEEDGLEAGQSSCGPA